MDTVVYTEAVVELTDADSEGFLTELMALERSNTVLRKPSSCLQSLPLHEHQKQISDSLFNLEIQNDTLKEDHGIVEHRWCEGNTEAGGLQGARNLA